MLALQIHPSYGQSGTQLLQEFTIGDSNSTKFPSVAAHNQTVYIGSGVSANNSGETTDAMIWSMNEQATSAGSRFSIGSALGKTDYSSVAVATGSDGVVFAAWSSINERRIFMSRRDPSSGVWSTRQEVTAADFPIFPQVAVVGNNQAFIIWQGVNTYLSLKIWNQTTNSWSPVYNTTQKTYSTAPAIRAGSGGHVGIGFTTKDLQAAVAIWTGNGLSTEILTSAGNAADTGVAVDSTGKFYAAWRSLGSGIFYAERQAANSWASAQFATGSGKGAVNVVVDAGGTVHLGWISEISGSLRGYYSYRQSGQSSFVTAAATSATVLFNSRLAVSSGGAYAHLVAENFAVGPQKIEYARFRGGTPLVTATPKIAGGTEVIKGATSVSVTFENPQGSPASMIWRWNAAPTEAVNDSGGWQSFATTKTINVPTAVLDAASCLKPSTLYVQLRNASQVTGLVVSDSVIFDTGVTAFVTMINPYSMDRPTTFTPLANELGDFSTDGGASDGHPGYTREQQIYIGIQGVNECGGLKTVAIGRTSTSFGTPMTITNNLFSNVQPVPGTFPVGSNQVWIKVTDGVGNEKTYNTTITYDPNIPSFGGGSFTATSNPNATILTALNFSNVLVTDDYPGRHFWGVWLANSRTNNPTNTALVWYPVEAPGTTNSFTIQNWSLLGGLKASDISTGTYYVFARMLDGAGNPVPEAAIMVATVNLSELTYPKIHLPIVVR
ncbi:hypothetical protein OSCT_1280 [Oscillochloris trichoides DG-6]|uniref:Uncharacterized protein n=1 Tax=Oscillochloris trichoides DG-6 TaxID=765420 RepID=E1ID79_9CHLR|nr:hypothetical protein OSCT_1280 [Oscillochloris trichoides DG-6]